MLVTFASAFFTSIVSTATLLFLAGHVGWQAFEPIPENCYEDYLTEPNCFCERPSGEEPGDVWFAQPANSASNIAFVVVGLLIALACDLKLPRRYWEQEEQQQQQGSTTISLLVDNPFTKSRGYGILFSCVVCLMGPGSAALHGSLTVAGRRLDQFCMQLIGAFLVVYSATRKRRDVSFRAFFIFYLVLLIPLLILTILSDNTELKRLIFSILLAITIALEVWHKILGAVFRKYCVCRNQQPQTTNIVAPDTANAWYMVAAVGFVAGATIIWIPSKSGGPLCFPDSWFQGHALWHVFTALSVGCVFLYAISANEASFPDGGTTTKSSDNQSDTIDLGGSNLEEGGAHDSNTKQQRRF